MTALVEKVARQRWLIPAEAGGDVKFRHCDTCGRDRDDDGKPLLVARQPRSRKFECLDCWDQGAR